ncbi:MAG: DUF4835 family protein [Bacteroidia bacterium]|nr:DUF4835 family protein [Bacteroidia bacterium]
MKIRILLAFLSLFLVTTVQSQELNCNVDINYSQIQGSTNKQIFDQMKNSILQFMNNTKWTSEIFAPNEKIECSILIVIKEVIGTDEYSGTIQVTSNRPVYKSSYTTPVFNMEDEYFIFKFQQFTQLEFNINIFQNNLTSILQYYAYVILANDYDTFSSLGGTQYWQKAQVIVQNAQNATESGWKSNQSGLAQRNRYWLVENALQPAYKGLRDCMYEYNFKGLDHMYENVEDSRATISKALELLVPIYRQRSGLMNLQVFFNAKREEIVNIFKSATPEEKTKVLEILATVDPANTNRYSKITGQ